MSTSTTATPPILSEAADRPTHLGFLLVSPFPPGARDAELLVSIRREPTLKHFDPEAVRFWRTGSDRRGHASEHDRALAADHHEAEPGGQRDAERGEEQGRGQGLHEDLISWGRPGGRRPV